MTPNSSIHTERVSPARKMDRTTTILCIGEPASLCLRVSCQNGAHSRQTNETRARIESAKRRTCIRNRVTRSRDCCRQFLFCRSRYERIVTSPHSRQRLLAEDDRTRRTDRSHSLWQVAHQRSQLDPQSRTALSRNCSRLGSHDVVRRRSSRIYRATTNLDD